jgi:O-antigen/teichoic acid export membrane protein
LFLNKKVSGKPMVKGAKRAIFQTFLTNLALQGGAAFSGIISARFLKPEGRGELATIMLWPTILGGLGLLGTNWALTREAATNPDKEPDLARTAVIIALGLGSITMVLGYFMIPHLLPNDKKYLNGLSCMFLFWIIPNFIILNLNALDHGRGRWSRLNLMRLLFFLFYLSFLLFLFFLNVVQVTCVVTAMLVSYGSAAILRIYSLRKEVFKGKTSLPMLRAVLVKGLHFFVAGIIALIALEMDKALVVWFLSTEEVGLYAVAMSVASLHASLGGALGLTTFSAMANLKEPAQQRDYVTQVFRQASLLYLGASPIIALLAPLIIVPLYGAEFAQAVQVAMILVVATTLVALANILNEGLRGMGHVYVGMASQACACVVMLITVLIFVPYFHILGVGLAAVVAGFCQLLLMALSVKYFLNTRLTQLWGLRPGEARLLCRFLYSLFFS